MSSTQHHIIYILFPRKKAMPNQITRADLHNHINYKSIHTFDEIINAIEANMGGNSLIGLANFGEEDKRYENFVSSSGYERINHNNAIYIPEKRILIVKGQEIPTREGHILALGIPSNHTIKSGRNLEDTLKEIKENFDALIILDHPFSFGGAIETMKKHPKLFENIDGIEIFNSEVSFGMPFTPLLSRANQKAFAFYEEYKSLYPHLGAIISSDGHRIEEYGKSFTFISLPQLKSLNSPEKINASLKQAIRNSKGYGRRYWGGAFYGLIHILEIIKRQGINKIIQRVKEKT